MSKKYLDLEVRQLAEKMEELRKGKFSSTDIEKYITRLEIVKHDLVEELESWCSYLNRDINIPEIPVLSINEAEKREYLSGYADQDFQLCGMLRIFQENPALQPPDPGYASVFIMLLQAAINDLSWAIGELTAHTK